MIGLVSGSGGVRLIERGSRSFFTLCESCFGVGVMQYSVFSIQ